MLASIALTAALMMPSGIVSGPYHIAIPVIHLAPGKTVVNRIWTPDECRGWGRSAKIVMSNGRETLSPRASIGRYSWVFRPSFNTGMTGRWRVIRLSYTCQDGSWGNILAPNPSFMVEA